MAILTVNWPNMPKGKTVTVPGIAGYLENGNKYDVGDQLEDDLVLGEAFTTTVPISELITHISMIVTGKQLQSFLLAY